MTEGPVFVVGAQRSGTTALGLSIASAARAAGGCFTVNGKLLTLLRRWCEPQDLEARHFRGDEVAHALRRKPPLATPSAWLERTVHALDQAAVDVAGGVVTTVDDLVRLVCERAYGDGFWGDKYNEYLLDLDSLDRWYPRARWVFLFRHPAEVVASMAEWQGHRPWNPRDTEACARKWTVWNRRWLDFRDRVPPQRRAEVDYSQLCQGRTARLSEVLGLPMEAWLSGFRRRREPIGSASLPDEADEMWATLRRLSDLP